jgi:hypothetical protein
MSHIDHDRHQMAGQPSPPDQEGEFNVVEEAEMLRLDIDLGRVWNGIAGDMWASPVGRVERSAASLLGSPALARALVSTPSLLLSWILASAAVFAIGAVVMAMTGTPIVPLVAPVVATAGVSFAYGAGADPAYELARTMPTSARMVLLVRVVAVLATNVVLGAIASLLTPGASGITVLWLLPMLAIALLGLALATATRSPTIGSAGALSVWGTIVMATELNRSITNGTGSGTAFVSAVAESTLLTAAPFYGLMIAASVFVIVWMSADIASPAGRPAGRAAGRRGGERW